MSSDDGIGIEPLVKVGDVARILGVSRATVYSWVNQRKIPHLRVEGVLRFDVKMVRVWLREKVRVNRGQETRDVSEKDTRKVVRGRLDRLARRRADAVSEAVAPSDEEGNGGVRAGVCTARLIDLEELRCRGGDGDGC